MKIGRIYLLTILLLAGVLTAVARGTFHVSYVAHNAVRIQYQPDERQGAMPQLPDWIYVQHDEVAHPAISATVKDNTVVVRDAKGHVVFKAMRHEWGGYSCH